MSEITSVSVIKKTNSDTNITLDQIESASRIVYAEMQPTPQYCWPLLCES